MAKKKKENTRRFCGKDGEFVPSVPRKDGKLSIQYLEELCEWVYFHNVYTDEEKLKHILGLENIVRKFLKELVAFKCNYIPTWSTKLEKDIKKKLKKNKI
jgi:hypothetical protein